MREFLASEAMHHLGVPTTRALSLVASASAKVQRQWCVCEKLNIKWAMSPSITIIDCHHNHHHHHRHNHFRYEKELKKDADSVLDGSNPRLQRFAFKISRQTRWPPAMVVAIMMDILQSDGSATSLPDNIKQALKAEWDSDNQAKTLNRFF